MDTTLTRLAGQWALTIEGPPVETHAGRVFFVRHRDLPCILKLYGPSSDEHDSAAVLEHYGGSGAVRLVAHDPEGVLIERAAPGGDLTAMVAGGHDDEATAIIADTIAALHRPPGLLAGLRTVETIADGFDHFLRRGGDRRIETTMVTRAAGIYRDLTADQAPPVVLHGDLHHFNILRDDRRGWLAIDPKGLIGEPAYEVGASLRNPISDAAYFADAGIISRRMTIYAERLGFDRQRMIGWCFSQAVLATIWAIEDGWDPSLGIAMIEAALPLTAITS